MGSDLGCARGWESGSGYCIGSFWVPVEFFLGLFIEFFFEFFLSSFLRPHQPGGTCRRSNAHPSGVPSLGREPWKTVSLGQSVLRFDRSVGRFPRGGARCEI